MNSSQPPRTVANYGSLIAGPPDGSTVRQPVYQSSMPMTQPAFVSQPGKPMSSVMSVVMGLDMAPDEGVIHHIKEMRMGNKPKSFKFGWYAQS